MSLALVDEGSVGKGDGETCAHIIYVVSLGGHIVKTCHRALYDVASEVKRSIWLGVWSKRGRKGH